MQDSTFKSWWLFTIVIVISFFWAVCAEPMRLSHERRLPKYINKKTLLFSFSCITLLLMVGCTDSGVDYYNYIDIIERNHYTFKSIFEIDNIEPLFKLLSWIIMSLFNNPHIILFLIKIVTIIIYFRSFYIAENKIDISLSVLAFLSEIFPGTFYILRQNLAASLICLCFSHEINNDNTTKKNIIYLLIAVGFHYSSALYLAVYLFYLAYKSRDNRKNRIRMLLFALVVIVAYFSLSRMVGILTQLDLYSLYLDDEQTYDGTGLLQIFYYMPVFIFLYLLFKKKILNTATVFGFIYTAVAFLCASAGYFLPMFIRMRYYNAPVFCILVPYFVKSIKKQKITFHISNERYLIYGIFVCYFIFKMYMTYSMLLAPDNDSQLYWYHFFIDLSIKN